ncbi:MULTISPECIES: hypothetical protein [Nocardia]|uniref:hypothetical protein n=1 Tax=Nocardia TaxID=1817 RepID=UPI0018932106|nr:MULTISPECIES: hypothetical protein [Nocardia]MBF6351348.1 hypothetical protein [Nocardia flavorosea]
MREIHPDVVIARDATRELRHRIADLRDKVENIVARRPSPSGLVIPEVDAFGRLRDLYFAPGTCARLDNDELVADIMAAITESARDARHQYYTVMSDRSATRPLAQVMAERRAALDSAATSPTVGTKNNEQEIGGGKD